MSAHTLLDLRRHPTWEPAHALLDTFRWPELAATFPLRDLATQIAPASTCGVGAAVITPQSIDPVLGGVRRRSRKYQGAAYQVGSELRPGDLLVPPNASAPVLLITNNLAGALVSAAFIALRPRHTAPPVWLWAMLSSRSGQELRRAHALTKPMMKLGVGDLLELPIPLPPEGRLGALMPRLREIASTTQVPETEALETWWRTADLRSGEWRLMLSTPRPEALEEGDPLVTYCSEIVRGRALTGAAWPTREAGCLPVADIGMLRSGSPRRWVAPAPASAIGVHAGDVCVAAVGERPNAAVVEEEAIADPHVFVMRLHSPEIGPGLARYLNSREGLGLRRAFLTGITVPSLRRGDLEKLPIPSKALRDTDTNGPESPVGDRLEEALWSN